MNGKEHELDQEWMWAAIIIAIPVVIFGAVEIVGLMRRRRDEAIARRPKDVRRKSSPGSSEGRAG